MPQQLSLDLESVTPPRKELRELWTPDDIFKALLKDGPAILAHFSEDNRIEWKSARYQARELNDYFSMWANTQPYGGLIVVGVEKDGAQSGCHCVGTQKLSELESAGSDYCPDAQFESRRIQFRRADGENDFLLAIRVFYRPEKLVETTRGEAFVRASNKETEEVVASQIRDFTRLGNDGKFYTRPEYPSDVWLEAIVNARVHRSYNLRNMNIFVKIFDNRLVVESPGAFPPPVTPENIYDTHNPRNPHLMNALFYLDYVKCAHEGTRRMRDHMKGASLPEPEFAQKEIGTYQVHVTLRNNIEARKHFVDAGLSS